jgi:CBS domain-containing protein
MKAIGSLVTGREIIFVESRDSVMSAVGRLVENNIGAAPVLEAGRLAGIFSERDLMTRIVAAGKDPLTLKVDEVMTRDLVVARAQESVHDCLARMRSANIRHLPVVEADQLIGFLSLRDLLLVEITEKTEEIEYLTAYIHFTPPIPESGGGS